MADRRASYAASRAGPAVASCRVPERGHGGWRADPVPRTIGRAQGGVPFSIVVEPHERDLYAARYPGVEIKTVPFSHRGVVPVRNWVFDDALEQGVDRFWILDDNISRIRRAYKDLRLRVESPGVAFAVTEDIADRFENVAICGLEYSFFGNKRKAPLALNCRVYSFALINTAIPYRWRGIYNEDTDLCLQVLSGGWCTFLNLVFLAVKQPTMTMKGGNTDSIYTGDGRLKMARSLERLWPGVVTVDRRFRRPQHVVDWSHFTTPLKLREGVTLDPTPNEYGLKLAKRGPVTRRDLKAIVESYAADGGVVIDAEPTGQR